MRVTIVGSGYIGQALARHWRQRPELEVTLTTTTTDRLSELEPLADHVALLRAGDAAALAEVLSGSEAVVFCHAPTGNVQVDAEGYRTTYRDSFLALQEVLPRLPQLRQIVYTGSCSVYGDAGGDWVDETTPCQPVDEHGQILLESEQLLTRCRSDQRRVCVLRLGAIHGPGRQVADRFSRLAGSTRPGDGNQHCSWIHRDDVVGAIDAALQQQWDDTVNLVDDQPWTVAALLDAVCRARDLKPVHWDSSQPSSMSADRRVRNRHLKDLGYTLRHPQLTLPRLQRIDQALMDGVAEQARQLPRLRLNHNLHQLNDGVQRFLNVLQPGTYVRPHRHERPGGFECFVVLQGAIGLLVLNEAGRLLECHRLQAAGPVRGIQLAQGQFHTLVALSSDSVIFEIKEGPYEPTSDKDFLPQFPAEGTAEAAAIEQQWRALFEPLP